MSEGEPQTGRDSEKKSSEVAALVRRSQQVRERLSELDQKAEKLSKRTSVDKSKVEKRG